MLVGEGPDGMLSGRVPMECCRGGSRWSAFRGANGIAYEKRREGGGVSVCGWIGTGNCEDYVNHESGQKIVIHE